MPPLSPPKNQPEKDMVMTPPELAQIIVSCFKITGHCLDPCEGAGAFTNALKSTESSSISSCEVRKGSDFFKWTEPVDWIVSNPPWSKYREFTEHAMGLTQNIVWLVTLNHVFTRARLRDLREHGWAINKIVPAHTPKAWPSSGFQVAAVHLNMVDRETDTKWDYSLLTDDPPYPATGLKL